MRVRYLGLLAVALAATGWSASAATCKVKLGGVIGERFDTSIRGNLLKLDLEKDFFSPFVARKAKSGTFVGLGKNADAAVHYAANIERDCREEDELFGPEAHAARNRGD